MPFAWASSQIASISTGFPPRSTGAMIFVRGLMRSLMLSTSIFPLSGLTSAQRTSAPHIRAAFAVAAKVIGVVSSSSPAPSPKAR